MIGIYLLLYFTVCYLFSALSKKSADLLKKVVKNLQYRIYFLNFAHKTIFNYKHKTIKLT
jgi:hypothetical protein